MTAGRDVVEGGATVAGRAATLNGSAAGRDTGVGGGSGVRREWMCAREVSEVLGVSMRHARRLARPYLVGMWTDYDSPHPARTAYYRADAVIDLARARAGSTCTVCGAPCRSHATTCGTHACACKAYRQRRDERARATRKARGIAW